MTVSVPISALIALGFGYLLGTVPFDQSVTRAVHAQEPVVLAYPQSPAAAAYRAIAARLWKPVPSGPEFTARQSSHRLEA